LLFDNCPLSIVHCQLSSFLFQMGELSECEKELEARSAEAVRRLVEATELDAPTVTEFEDTCSHDFASIFENAVFAPVRESHTNPRFTHAVCDRAVDIVSALSRKKFTNRIREATVCYRLVCTQQAQRMLGAACEFASSFIGDGDFVGAGRTTALAYVLSATQKLIPRARAFSEMDAVDRMRVVKVLALYELSDKIPFQLRWRAIAIRHRMLGMSPPTDIERSAMRPRRVRGPGRPRSRHAQGAAGLVGFELTALGGPLRTRRARSGAVLPGVVSERFDPLARMISLITRRIEERSVGTQKTAALKFFPEPYVDEPDACVGDHVCTACLSRASVCAPDTCGHRVLCVTCSLIIKQVGDYRCPVCRAPFTGILHVRDVAKRRET